MELESGQPEAVAIPARPPAAHRTLPELVALYRRMRLIQEIP